MTSLARKHICLALAGACSAAVLLGASPAVASAPAGHAYRLVAVSQRTGHVSTFSVTTSTPGAALSSGQTTHRGQAVSLDVLRSVSADDPGLSSAWQVTDVGAPQAWSQGGDGSGITVAVVDTGVDATHPDLAGQVLPGTDFVSTGDGETDPNGHGTHVAGIIAAVAGNGIGIAGISPGAKVLPVRVLAADGTGWDSDVISGITWAADHGANVINLSLSGTTSDSALDAAMTYAHSKGALVVSAAGNDYLHGNPTEFPAAYSSTLAVAAVDQTHQHAQFSSAGSWVDLSAPGVSVYSTVPGGGYQAWSGTSMAAPVVAGAAADVMSAHPTWNWSDVSTTLESTATDLGTPGPDDFFGVGEVNVAAAVAALHPGDGPNPPPVPRASLTLSAPGVTPYLHSAWVNAVLTAGHQPLAGRTVKPYTSNNDKTWHLRTRARTGAGGKISFSLVMSQPRYVKAVFIGDATHHKVVSKPRFLRTRTQVKIQRVIRVGNTVSVHATTKPLVHTPVALLSWAPTTTSGWRTLAVKRSSRHWTITFTRPFAAGGAHTFRLVATSPPHGWQIGPSRYFNANMSG